MTSQIRHGISRRHFLRLIATASAAAPLASFAPPALFTSKLLRPSLQAATVTVWGWPTQITRSFDADGTDLIVQRVKEEAGVDVELNLVDQPDLSPKLRAALPAGTGPDVITTDFDVMGPYWQFMTNLNPFGEKEWGADWKTKIFTPTAVTEMDLVSQAAGRPDEVLYIPGNMQLLGWPYYWIPDFEANDIDPTTFKTYDDFIATCTKLKAAGLVPLTGSNHPAELADWYKALVEVAAPGQMDKAQHGEARFTDPDMVTTFDLVARLYKEFMQDGAIGTDAATSIQNFQGHKTAMTMTFAGTPWFGFLANDNEQVRKDIRNSWGTFQLPGGKGLAATDAGMAIVDASTNKDAAWEFVKWNTVGKGAEYNAHDASSPFGAAAIEPSPTGTDFDKNLATPLFNALKTGDNVFRRILCPDVYNAVTQAIPGVVTGQIDAATAAQSVQDAFDSGCGQWVTSS